MTRCYSRNGHGDRCNKEYRHDEDSSPYGQHNYPRAVLRYLDSLGPLTDAQAIAYLTDESGMVPCSRYGRTSGEYAIVALAVATIVEGETGEARSVDSLEHIMSLVVDNHDDPASLLLEYGTEYRYVVADLLD